MINTAYLKINMFVHIDFCLFCVWTGFDKKNYVKCQKPH